MTRCRLPGRSTALATLALLAATLAVTPASAQVSSFLDSLFGRKSAPEAAPAPAPAPVEAVPDAGVAQTGAVPTRVPLPPRRPSALGRGIPEEAPVAETGPREDAPREAPSPRSQVAAAGSPGGVPQTADDAVVRANLYFNGVSTLYGDFVQVAADGRRTAGKIYLARPGRLRFDYDAPSPLEIVSDGSSVAVRDRKLATQDLYPLGQTPLKFLVRERIDLAADLKVVGVENEPGGVRVSLEDRSTLGGTSRIVLYFDPAVRALTQWRITDPQGFQTTVILSNIEKGRRLDAGLFTINYERVADDRR